LSLLYRPYVTKTTTLNLPSFHHTDISQAAADGRGATIFTNKNFNGRSTAIPANDFCTDIDNIFGNFDGKIRSVTVEKGYHCKFYTYVIPISLLLLGKTVGN